MDRACKWWVRLSWFRFYALSVCLMQPFHLVLWVHISQYQRLIIILYGAAGPTKPWCARISSWLVHAMQQQAFLSLAPSITLVRVQSGPRLTKRILDKWLSSLLSSIYKRLLIKLLGACGRECLCYVNVYLRSPLSHLISFLRWICVYANSFLWALSVSPPTCVFRTPGVIAPGEYDSRNPKL